MRWTARPTMFNGHGIQYPSQEVSWFRCPACINHFINTLLAEATMAVGPSTAAATPVAPAPPAPVSPVSISLSRYRLIPLEVVGQNVRTLDWKSMASLTYLSSCRVNWRRRRRFRFHLCFDQIEGPSPCATSNIFKFVSLYLQKDVWLFLTVDLNRTSSRHVLQESRFILLKLVKGDDGYRWRRVSEDLAHGFLLLN